MSRVIAIANQKGGVGKTTTAVNLSASLAAAEQDTLVIDLDPQGNTTSGFGIAKDQHDNMYHALMFSKPLVEIYLSSQLEHLKLLPSASAVSSRGCARACSRRPTGATGATSLSPRGVRQDPALPLAAAGVVGGRGRPQRADGTAMSWCAVAPLGYKGGDPLQRDIANMKAALAAAGVEEGFLPVVAPASAINGRQRLLQDGRRVRSTRSRRRCAPSTSPSTKPAWCCRSTTPCCQRLRRPHGAHPET